MCRERERGRGVERKRGRERGRERERLPRDTIIPSLFDYRKVNRNLRVARRSVMEISKMKKLRKQTRENRLRNEKNMKLALQSGGYVPVRSLNITQPKEFNFAICNKMKEHSMTTRSSAEKPFETKLRKDSTKHVSSHLNS